MIFFFLFIVHLSHFYELCMFLILLYLFDMASILNGMGIILWYSSKTQLDMLLTYCVCGSNEAEMLCKVSSKSRRPFKPHCSVSSLLNVFPVFISKQENATFCNICSDNSVCSWNYLQIGLQYLMVYGIRETISSKGLNLWSSLLTRRLYINISILTLCCLKPGFTLYT